jgi:hypothetical protein
VVKYFIARRLGIDPHQYTARQMSYDLRRLRLQGIIYRQHGSTKYWLTTYGIRVAMFLTRIHAHVLRPGLYVLDAKEELQLPHRLSQAFKRINQEIDNMFKEQYLGNTA